MTKSISSPRRGRGNLDRIALPGEPITVYRAPAMQPWPGGSGSSRGRRIPHDLPHPDPPPRRFMSPRPAPAPEPPSGRCTCGEPDLRQIVTRGPCMRMIQPPAGPLQVEAVRLPNRLDRFCLPAGWPEHDGQRCPFSPPGAAYAYRLGTLQGSLRRSPVAPRDNTAVSLIEAQGTPAGVFRRHSHLRPEGLSTLRKQPGG